MPIHDWSKVEAGIFHDFRSGWVCALGRSLNNGILPPDYYALSQQDEADGEPDFLVHHESGTGLLVAKPKTRIVESTDADFYRGKQRIIMVRHVTDDRVVAVIEIVSPGNKNKHGIRSFLDKVKDLLKNKIHMLVIDLHPPGKHDAHGIHAAIWDTVWSGSDAGQPEKPLTVASYECNDHITAYVEPVAVGDALPDSPLYLVPDGYVLVPLEKTYQAAWEGVPRRWRSVIDPTS